jgi:hypothetical protein
MNRRGGCVQNEISLHQDTMPQPPTATRSAARKCFAREARWGWVCEYAFQRYGELPSTGMALETRISVGAKREPQNLP